MRPKDHRLPETGPQSNPILYGVAYGLNELFPPVELSTNHDEIRKTNELDEDNATFADDQNECAA